MGTLRSWIAVALLAGSWMFGLDYFYPADYGVWAVTLVIGTMLLGGTAVRLPGNREVLIVMAILLPAAIWTPWPYAIIPLLLILGLLLQLLPILLRWSKPLGQGIIAAGCVLLAQALVLTAYTAQTARSHELPWPLPDFLAGVARLFSIDAAFDGVHIVFRTVRQTHRLAPTWEFFFDPVTLCFLIGGMVFLGLKVAGELPPDRRWPQGIRGLRIFTLMVLAWLPIRAGLLMALYVHRVLNYDPERWLNVMNHFFGPWPLLIFTAVPALLAWRFVRIDVSSSLADTLPKKHGKTHSDKSSSTVLQAEKTPARIYTGAWRYFAALLLFAAAVVVYTLAVEWSPVGTRNKGRVKFVERHSHWASTVKPYDTTWYGEKSSYNLAAIYDYLGQYYPMSRILEEEKIDDDSLEGCDVLVIRTPTARYSSDEVAAVLKFVKRGGGVLFIGDHTNLDSMGTIMNDMARPMGFIFRDDLLFTNERTKMRLLGDVGKASVLQDDPTSPDEKTCYHQFYQPPWPGHPALQYMPPMDFAVSCSIDPGSSRGRAVIANTGLWNMPPEYHTENYHPIPQHLAAMRYGAFVQLWATTYGNGRAMAFTDSTIFSNFCIYQPGKAELMLGMVEWLNHKNPPLDARFWLNLLGTILLMASAWLALRGGYREGSGVCFVAVGMAGWIGTCGLVTVLHRMDMPLPEVKNPMLRVVIDRTTSTVPLSKGAYTKGENGTGYGLMEQWISRLRIDRRGCYTIRQENEASFSGDALVTICPTRDASEDFCKGLAKYVENGGKLLLFDSPDNAGSTANRMLAGFGLKIDQENAKNPLQGSLILKDQWPNIPVESACRVSGGTAIAQIDGKPVAALAHYGKGTVMVVGFSSLFNDMNLGGTWTVDPKSPIKQRFNTFYALVRSLLRNQPIEPTGEAFGEGASPESSSVLGPNGRNDPSKPPLVLPDLPSQEMGPRE